MIHRHRRHRHRHAIRTMNSGVTTQEAGGIQIAVPVTGHSDNTVILSAEWLMRLMDTESCACK